MSEESNEETTGGTPDEGILADALKASGTVESSEESEAAAMKAFLVSDEGAPEIKEPAAPVCEVAAKPASTEELAEDTDEELEEKLELRPVPDDGIKRRWYAVHAHSGQEGNVREMLLQGSEALGLADMVCNVLVPMEEFTELRSGEKKMSSRKFFPGYVLVQLPEHPERNAELWQLVKETPGVTGFIGSRNVPIPLEDEEVMAIVEVVRGERERPKVKVAFEIDEQIKIIDGPFANFLGRINEVNAERGNMKVQVEIFERLTNVEVEFWQVEKV